MDRRCSTRCFMCAATSEIIIYGKSWATKVGATRISFRTLGSHRIREIPTWRRISDSIQQVRQQRLFVYSNLNTENTLIHFRRLPYSSRRALPHSHRPSFLTSRRGNGLRHRRRQRRPTDRLCIFPVHAASRFTLQYRESFLATGAIT